VYDYEAGKQDWAAFGLPTEGTLAERPRAGNVSRRDAPTCRLEETLGPIKERVRASGFDVCVVVNGDRIVLGMLREEQLSLPDDLTAEQAMRVGPSTFRPNVGIMEMAEFMVEHDLGSAPVTTSDGRLVGLLVRDDALRTALEEHRREHGASDQEDDDDDES
jgi:CBS domain-containing protein